MRSSPFQLLNSIPSHVFGLSILPQNFRIALQYRLGLPVYNSPHPCPACGKDSDVYGDHTITCATENERIFRHDTLRDAIFEEARHAGLSPVKEARDLITGNQSRPGDIFLPSWHRRQTAFDVAVTSPLSQSALPRASRETGAAIESMKASKMNKHFRACQVNGVNFIPLVVETLGGIRICQQTILFPSYEKKLSMMISSPPNRYSLLIVYEVSVSTSVISSDCIRNALCNIP